MVAMIVTTSDDRPLTQFEVHQRMAALYERANENVEAAFRELAEASRLRMEIAEGLERLGNEAGLTGNSFEIAAKKPGNSRQIAG